MATTNRKKLTAVPTTPTPASEAHGAYIPSFDMGDRLRKAREHTGLGVRAFAAELGVSHGTVTNAEKGHRDVRRITLNAWSHVTGVPVEWLLHGTLGQED